MMTTRSDAARSYATANANNSATPSHRHSPSGRDRLVVALRSLLALLCACATSWTAPAWADDEFKFVDGELGINVYGLSYHFQRTRAKEIGVDNELNPGLGLRYQFAEWKRFSFAADVGIFEDSGREAAKLVGASAMWHFGGGFRAGGALVLFDSHTYNRGNAFIAPLPLLSYDVGPVTLNLTYFPKVSQYNEISTLGFWITVWPGRW
jgi:hypothetical protein